MNVAQIMDELDGASKALDKVSTQLANATKQFEGWYEETESVDPSTGEILVKRGDFKLGPQLRFRSAVTVAMEEIRNSYLSDEKKGRPPAVELLERLAEMKVEKEQPELFIDYHRLRIEIDASQKWIAARNKTISARQSLLSAEKALVNG